MPTDGTTAISGVRHLTDCGEPPFTATIRDIGEAAVGWRVWVGLGIFDIRARYRRTSLGPFWIVIATTASIALLGVMYGTIFRFDLQVYLPFIAVGLVVWSLLSGLLSESPSILYMNDYVLRNYRISPMVFALRMIVRQAIIFLHNLVPLVIVFVLFRVPFTTAQLLAPLGLLIVFLNGLWLAVLLGIIGARFRDTLEIVNLILSIAFLSTPVMWRPEMLGDFAFLADYNPLAHLLTIVRAPLLGEIPDFQTYLCCLLMLAIGGVLSIAVYHRFRRYTAFWM